ncbi:hypothetical protein QAD02_009402 [Eretmocerus hayati]|uniref:Uncharacterized protein n=1 Tax=Eretmocerus hayati TaxID=131215 RepID=A0ACC2N9L5_9HYME|nr:hypothetical protein QAD02_009402 [Eretmocerus hayati]
MERWNGKVAVVTGATSGIGLATAKSFVKHGLIVVGLARRKSQMEDNMKNVQGPGKFFAKECDVTKENNIIEVFNWIKKTFGSLHILVNNAGTIIFSKIEDTPSNELDRIIDVNLKGLLFCSKHAIKIMRETQSEAHIVNISSVAGHEVPPVGTFPPLNVYPATKFAVRALSETLRNELIDSKIRVTNVSPGAVKTEILNSAQKAELEATVVELPILEADDIANAIGYVIGLPPHVEINELKLTPKKLH